MSASSPVASDPSKPIASVLCCNVCGYKFITNDYFFCCFPCQREDFNVCQSCVLDDAFSAQGHHPRPCFLDSRDDRPTFLPEPETSEFKSLVTNAREDPSFKFPAGARKLLSHCEIEGLSKERLLTESAYSHENVADVHTIANDYSLYDKLDSELKDIRIIQLLKGSVGDPVMVLLARFAFPWDQVPFVALSYRWGELDETRSILVMHLANRLHDGGKPQCQYQHLTLTANLEIALRGIRKEDENVWVWIDAICINQGDLDERGAQVSNMAEIYRRAAGTVIWLGLSTEEAASVPYIQALATLIKRVREEDPTASEMSSLVKIVRSGQISMSGQPIDHALIVKKIAGFFRNPYFQRVWVLQEVVYTTADIYVIANRNVPVLLWEQLIVATTYLSTAFVLLKTGASGLISPWQDIEKHRVAKDDGPPDFLPLLELFDAIMHRFHATDQRDKLFALLAIARETQGMSGLSPLIRPNYNKPVAQVFIDLTRWCIQHYKTLYVLGYVTYVDRRRILTREEDTPSWALSTKPRFEGSSLKLCEVEQFRAAADTSLDLTLLDSHSDESSLHLRGYRLFTVTRAERHYFSIRWDTANELYLNDEATRTYYSGGVHWLYESLRGVNGKHARFCDPVPGHDFCSGKHALDQFLLMLTCGGWKEHGDCDHSKGIHRRRRLTSTELYEMFATYWINHGEDRADPDLELFCPHMQEILRPLAGKGDPEEFAMNLAGHATKKCIFMVDGGAGLGPLGTQKDDIVVALFGGRTPFILRPRQTAGSDTQEWEFIGECFFNNVMDGQHVEDMIKRHEPSEVFKLR